MTESTTNPPGSSHNHDSNHSSDSGDRSYATLKSADSLAHLAEQLTGEAERFERETGLRLATVRVTRDKEAGTLKLLKVTVS